MRHFLRNCFVVPVADVAGSSNLRTDCQGYVVKILELKEEEKIPMEFCDLYDVAGSRLHFLINDFQLLMAVGELHPVVLTSVLHAVNGEKFPSVATGSPLSTVIYEFQSFSRVKRYMPVPLCSPM
jgi:hypothetical protein